MFRRYLDRFRRWSSGTERPGDNAELAQLQLEFKSCFHSFKLLLHANNSALEKMARIEQALAGRAPFGMPFIRAAVTSAAVDVFRMIQNLDALSAGKYGGLEERFSEIQQSIVKALNPVGPKTPERLIVPFDEITGADGDWAGPKMARLCEARNRLQMRVPDGFLITARAYHRLLNHNDLQAEINRRMQIVDFSDLNALQETTEGIEQIIRDADVPPDVSEAIHDGYHRLIKTADPRQGVALRSSALGEDLARTSFAGQYHSRLNVTDADLIQAYKDVVASKYGLRAILYRHNRGFRDEDITMSVGCMRMVPATSGGVIYSRDPMDVNRDEVIIHSAWGLPTTVVNGRSSGDRILVSRKSPHRVVDVKLQDKSRQDQCAADGGIQEEPVSASERRWLSLPPKTAIRLAAYALKIEAHFGGPQDIEWALSADGECHILQCRPLQQIEDNNVEISTESLSIPSDRIICKGGISAAPGSGSGPIQMVENSTDMTRFSNGSILVVREALPRWAPLLDRASAVITGHGSFASHLGNVAREFGVPAVFDLGDVSSLFSNGEQVTVDAGQRTVFRGRIESLLARSEDRKNLIEGSPVHRILSSVSRHVVPLNLLDPDASDFQPSSCQTLHDISRFVHEKSIQELFNFGQAHRFTEKISKQLVYDVPMQWWVLNLDDGFSREISGRRVHLDDICSIPMQAIWDGIVAVPWRGPPPIDGRGLMSVLFQGSSNRSVAVGQGNGLAERNYFMISRYFCSLTSRLGYHFSTIESVAGDTETDNYICFQFRGGAADHQRRNSRVRFLADILEENGFRTTLQDDKLIARIESRDTLAICQKLKILGYLTIHTRQLDMIMNNRASVAFYRDKIRKDLLDIIDQAPTSLTPALADID